LIFTVLISTEIASTIQEKPMMHTRPAPQLVLTALTGFFSLFGAASRADSTDQYLSQALGRLVRAIDEVDGLTTFGYIEGDCLFGSLQAVGDSAVVTVDLRKGRAVALFGAGDDDARDVDLVVTNSDGAIVAQDTDDDSTPVARFKPAEDGRYTIRLKLEASRDSASFCSLAILRENGWSIPIQDTAAAYRRCIDGYRLLAARYSGIQFGRRRGGWCLIGGVIPQGGDLGFSNMIFGAGNHILLAAADDHSQDVDLYLLEDGAIRAQDQRDDAVAIVEAETSEGHSYRLRVTNEKSRGPAMTIVVLLRQ
jgi:hypothetical protein